MVKEPMKALDYEDEADYEKPEMKGLDEKEIFQGERPCMNTEANYVKEKININGRLLMTNYRVVFVPDDPSMLMELRLKTDYFNIPIGFISK